MKTLVGSLVDTARSISNRAPVPYVSDRLATFSLPIFGRNDPGRYLETMTANATLFAIVDKCATSAAAIDWHLYRKAASGKEDERVEVTTHAALDLWNRPNSFFTQQEFVETVEQHYELTGEMWWVIGRDPRSNIPLELWPVRPDRMEPVADAYRFLVGYIYHGPDGEEVPLGLDEVIFARRPNPSDPYRGISAVAAALVHIEGAQFAAQWNRNFFRNSAEPGGVIQVSRKLSDPEFRMLRARWAEQHQGVANAHRVALLEGGAEWIERKYTQRDMEFTQLREATREDIREAFGFPKPLLGAVDDVNRANAEAAEYVFSKWVLVPRLERIKGALNADLLPLFGATDLEFDYDSPVDEDGEQANAERDSKVAAATAMIQLGADPAEVFEWLDLPDLAVAVATEDGAGSMLDPHALAELVQKLYLGVGPLITYGEARTLLAAAGMPVDPTAPPPPAPAPAIGPGEEGPPALPPGRRGGASENHWDEQVHRGQHDPSACAACRFARFQGQVEREDWEDRLDALLERWETEVTPGQIDALVASIETVVTNGAPADLAQLSAPTDVAEALLGDAMLDQAAAAGQRMAELAEEQGVAISPVTPWPTAQARLLGKTRRKAPTYSEGLGADLRAAARVQTKFLGQGLSAFAAQEALHHWQPGSAGTDVATAVRDRLESLTVQSLRTDLGSQIWAGENEGRFATLEKAAEDQSISVTYVADEVRDSNTCPACAEVDGKQYDDLAEAQADYPFGGYSKCDGRQRCRGTIRPDWS